MDVIVFVLLDTASHLNASFKLARALKSRDYSIVYLANPDNQTKIEEMGFMFFSKPKSYQLEEIAKNAPNAQVLKKKVEKGFLKGDLFKEVIHTFDPVLILLDTSLIYYSVLLFCLFEENKCSVFYYFH